MELGTLLLLACVAALGSFIQAFAGFALGLVLMGLATLFDLAPVPFTAAVVSLLVLPNGAAVLHARVHEVDTPVVLDFVLGLAPGIVLGVGLLDLLGARAPGLLVRILGGVIVLAAGMFLVRPNPAARRAARPWNLVVGFAGGLLGGLFSTAGPPLVLFLYRQPLEVTRIRSTLVATFVFAGAARALYLTYEGQMTAEMVFVCLVLVPVVVLVARATAPLTAKVPPQLVRRVTFALLILLGGALVVVGAPTSVP